MTRLKDWREVIDVDFPEQRITQKSIEVSQRMAQRGYRTDVRIAMGRVYTSEDYEARRKRIISTPLP